MTDRPVVMGILNVTPDSFSDGGQFADVDAAIERGAELALQGADLVDVGASRPGPVPTASRSPRSWGACSP